jgi:hypothetical protein
MLIVLKDCFWPTIISIDPIDHANGAANTIQEISFMPNGSVQLTLDLWLGSPIYFGLVWLKFFRQCSLSSAAECFWGSIYCFFITHYSYSMFFSNLQLEGIRRRLRISPGCNIGFHHALGLYVFSIWLHLNKTIKTINKTYHMGVVEM